MSLDEDPKPRIVRRLGRAPSWMLNELGIEPPPQVEPPAGGSMKRAALQVIAVVDIVFVVLLNLVACGGTFAQHGVVEGAGNIMSWYSPFNVASWIVNVVLLSPALICYWLMERDQPRK
jgi:hypothetical protein